MDNNFNPNSPSGIEIALVVAFYLVVILIALGIQCLICYVLYRAAKAIPENFRQASPGQAFLLLIPIFSLIWLFIYPKNLSTSFQHLFASVGQGSDDCGEKLGLWWAIASVCSIIPCVNIFTGVAALVLMILYLVKVSECRTRVLSLGKMGKPVPQFYGQ